MTDTLERSVIEELKGSVKTGDEDKDITFIQPKGTREKSEIMAMRRCRAQLMRFLTPEMLDAEYEIEQAFRLIAGHMGYGNSDPGRVKGQAEVSDQLAAKQSQGVKYFREWQKKSVYRGIVLDHLVFGKTIKDMKFERNLTRQTVVSHYRKGLEAYCEIRGWKHG